MASYQILRNDPDVSWGGAHLNNPQANYVRLVILVHQLGKEAAKHTVLTNLDGTQTLEQALQKFEKRVRQFLINPSQNKILYPDDGGPVKVEEIDLTSWAVLLRNVTKEQKKIKKNWEEDPGRNQRRYWHDVQRLKLIRNQLAHMGNAELNENDFKTNWTKTASALRRLLIPPNTIDEYLHKELEPEVVSRAVMAVKDQYLDDQRMTINDLKPKLGRSIMLIKMLAGLLAVLGVGIVVSIVVTVKFAKQWESCAKHMEYINTGVGLVSSLPRKGWGGRDPVTKDMSKLATPVPYVIISHTAQVASRCHTTDECCKKVKEIQDFHMDDFHFADIGFNYVLGGDGVVYIGRGPKYEGAAAKGWNHVSISVGFIGLFMRRLPSDEALDALTMYLDHLVDQNILAQNYTLYGLCQVREKFPDAPGAAFLKQLQIMFPDHWRNRSISNCNTFDCGS